MNLPVRAILLAFGFGKLVSAAIYTDDVAAQKLLWENFKNEHKKSYSTAVEEAARFGLFVHNLKVADQHHVEAKGSSFHGITLFMDKNFTELAASMTVPELGIKADSEHTHLRGLTGCTNTVTNTVKDWTGVLTSPMKNAGSDCLGSGWAFSVVSQIESDALRQYGSSYNYVLAPEQLLQCVTNNDGCNSGTTEYAYTYLKTNGLELNNNYPYTSYYGATGGPCAYNSAVGKVKVGGYFAAFAGNEGCMAHYVQVTGPLTTCLAASDAWYSYTGGIMSAATCPSSGTINHCVQVVGVYPVSSGGYWKIRSSFGSSWGEGGYIRLSYGENTCKLNNNPIYTSTTVS